ncbi:MAG: radical SAM family heme chaperone HemW [Eubacterium sp.]|nr:radical SAM family heme chaperone HemW [Eubacterium sp.]
MGTGMGLYIHIPFCVKKCGYCDFVSAPASEAVRRAYLGRLQEEIHAVSEAYRNTPVSTVFVGGGTPSVLSPEQMQHLFEQLRGSFLILPDAEITVECNPGSVDAAKLQAYLQSGVNRLSIGLQSADEKELRLLGRVHTYEQFAANYSMARSLGFENINVDIISAIPGQKLSTYEQTLQKVLALAPEHISAYSLILEEGTPFYDRYRQAEILREKGKQQTLLPTEEEERQMYVRTKQLLKKAGYHRYEISNYALDGYECRHNTGYWTRNDYLGLGLGAASLIGNIRFSNTTDLEQYLNLDFAKFYAGAAAVYKEPLSKQAQMEEFLFLGLRMMRGVSARRFLNQFSQSIEAVYGEVLERQLKEGFIRKTPDGYCLTEFGIDVSNVVMAEYLLDG